MQILEDDANCGFEMTKPTGYEEPLLHINRYEHDPRTLLQNLRQQFPTLSSWISVMARSLNLPQKNRRYDMLNAVGLDEKIRGSLTTKTALCASILSATRSIYLSTPRLPDDHVNRCSL